MAHSAMHLGIGLATGTAAALPYLKKALKKDTARNAARWLIIAYATAGVAVFPSFLNFIGVPETVTSGWYMNIYLLHPLINHLKPGGQLIGETLIVSCFFVQYAIMIYLLWRVRKKKKTDL